MKTTTNRDFRSLSVKDLIDGRDAYHIHLAHLDHVFGTAIGRYLIREDDDNAKNATVTSDQQNLAPRTLFNSSSKPWSWPCVLVFVNQWLSHAAIAENPRLSREMVPPFLFLSDGRVVPTCVVLVAEDDRPLVPANPGVFSSDLMGGGYPIISKVQGKEHVGSVGCLVTDGDSVYALTNRHVCGETGRPIFANFKNTQRQIGKSAALQTGKVPFSQLYPGWPGDRVLGNLDAGLVHITDVQGWTAQVYGVGEVGSLWDLNVDTFTLDVIGCPVTAFGAASGKMTGRIVGLFYRYKSVGGYDYVTDFLVGPRDPLTPVNNIPGNSGTVWFEDDADAFVNENQARRLRPIGLEWGGQVLLAPGAKEPGQFVLVSCLATICRQLDVEIIDSWNAGHREYWGEWGHVKIGALACGLVSDTSPQLHYLSELIMANADNIGMADADLQGKLAAHVRGEFAPLADVADLVWRNTRPLDESNHFADMDKVGKGDFKEKTLLDLCEDPANVSPDIWNAYYESIGEDRRGALPFRVWQFYDEMVKFANEGDLVSFVCAAGLVAHYVGDACQPLHISQYHHGKDPSDPAQSKVHSVYETTMIGRFGSELIELIASATTLQVPPIEAGDDTTVTGHDVAVAVVALMRRTVKELPPLTIVGEFNRDHGSKQTVQMWEALKKPTAQRMKDGAMTLARIWEAAWTEGRKNNAVPDEEPVACDRSALMDLYENPGFVRSYKLQSLTLDDSELHLVPRGTTHRDV